MKIYSLSKIKEDSIFIQNSPLRTPLGRTQPFCLQAALNISDSLQVSEACLEFGLWILVILPR